MSKDLKTYVKPYLDEKFISDWEARCSKYPNDFANRGNILPPVDKIIVIGDLHGDWNMTLNILDHAGVIKKKSPYIWTGGNTVIVQLGDQIDRCRGSGSQCHSDGFTKNDENNDWNILQYMTKLHSKALKKGGAVYSLLGNHELMNVEGDFRYVSYKGLFEFGNSNDYYKGFEERRKKFSRKNGGEISKFLGCTRYGVLVIGSNLFVHGGITDLMKKKYPGLEGLANLNRVVSRYLWNQIDKDKKSILDSADYSPFWNRVLGTCNTGKGPEEICSKLEDQLKVYQLHDKPNVNRIIIGHTPQYFYGLGANKTCKGKVIRADVGLSQAFDTADKNLVMVQERNSNRKPQYIEILNDKDINIKIID